MRLRRFFWLGLVILTGCNDDTVTGSDASAGETMAASGDGDGDPGDGDGSPGDGDGTPGDGDGSPGDGDGTPGDGDGDGDDGVPPEPFTPFAQADWARGGIRIDRVEVNQGIAIPVVANGALIPTSQRTAGLVKERNTLIQAFWVVPNGWQARPITARLHLRNTAGKLSYIDVTKTISGTPSAGSLTGPITWQVPGAAFQGNLEFFIELREAQAGGAGIAASSESPSAPAGGMQPIGVTTEFMEAKVVMVPVKYDYGNCHTDTTSVLTSNFQTFADHLFTQTPVHTLHIEIHPEKIVQTDQVVTLAQINNALVAKRFVDFAEPNEYYFALFNSCSGGVDGAGGLAAGLPGPTKGLGDLRVSTGLWTSINWSKDTFVHEVGHSQGRPHSPCGEAGGADDNFPHAGARIGTWGFDILTGQWYDPGNRRDFMSYCSPTWVSDWTWGLLHEQVRRLTAWDYAGASDGAGGVWAKAPDPELVEILHGWVHPSGLESWWTSPGELPPDMLQTTESIAYYDEFGLLIDQRPAATWMLEDGKTRYFMAEVPDSDMELVVEIVRVSRDVEARVPRRTVTRYFDRD